MNGVRPRFRTIQVYPKDFPLFPRQPEPAVRGLCMANLPADLRKLLEWLDRVSPLLEAQIVADGFNQTLDKALMRNFAEMNLREATVSITARGRDALSKFPVMRPRPGRALRRCRPRFSRRVPRQPERAVS
jgi:hypothetical protein